MKSEVTLSRKVAAHWYQLLNSSVCMSAGCREVLRSGGIRIWNNELVMNFTSDVDHGGEGSVYLQGKVE